MNFPFDESPSASSNSSSPSVHDVLQTPSDTSPIARRSPSGFDIYSSKARLTPSSAQITSPHHFESHNDAHALSVPHGAMSKSLDTRFMGLARFTPTPPRGSDALYNAHSAMLSSSSRSFPVRSFPLIEKPSPPPGLHHTLMLPPAPLTSYQGAFDPFGNDSGSGSGPVRFRSGSFRPSPNDDALAPWPHRPQTQTSISNNTSPDSSYAISSPDFPNNAIRESPPLYFCPTQRRSSTDMTHLQHNGFVNAGTPLFDQKPVTSFVGQAMFEPQQKLVSCSASASAVDSDFAGCDMLRGLGISGLNGCREKQHAGIIDDRSLEPSPVHNNNLYVNEGLSSISDKQQGNEVR